MSTYEFTTIAVTCPACSRTVIAEQPWDPGRVTTHLRVPEHSDVREALLEQPRCAGSHVSLHLQPDGLFFKGRRSAEDQVKVDQAVRLLGDDAVPSYRKAADVMRDLSGKNPEDGGALSLEVLARLGLVRYGVVAERRTAEERLQQVPPEQRGGPEAQKAQAVLDLVSGKPAEARRALEGLSRSPAGQRDPLAQVYLGWCDLRLAKYAQAEKDFQAALKLSPRLAGALLGIAQAKDKAGDRKGANAAYLKVRGVMADHFGASVGQILTADDPDSEAKLLDLMSKKGRNAGPRELADLWTLLGLRAREQSRTKDAEERLRRALQADATQGAAQVALAQIFCDKEKYAEATTLAQQAFRADPKNVEAGVVLVRALMSQKKPLDAGAPLLAIAKLAPKDARVLYWQGRREEEVAAQGADGKAAALYQKALEADGKYSHYLSVDEVQVLAADLERCGIPSAKDGRPLLLGRRLHLLALALVLEREAAARLRDSLSVADQLVGVPRG